ncbi:MAG: tetratricopeptide repeat protein [Azoarcus sp.]|nr:tetratricopeptide repeat protein [Azoarcus sp.]
MKRHAYVAMPVGSKRGDDGQTIDFKRVFDEYVLPALNAAGFKVIRADGNRPPCAIEGDTLQHLLMSDVVVADLTVDDPNVWYELGLRDALRATGVILVTGSTRDLVSAHGGDRSLRYHLKAGHADPDSLRDDRQRLTDLARSILNTPAECRMSPIHQRLPRLHEPGWRALQPQPSTTFTEACETWAARIGTAPPGNILVLADEAPSTALHITARLAAGSALMRLRNDDFALEQFECVLGLDPAHTLARQRRATCLVRLGRLNEARDVVHSLQSDRPAAPETFALAGDVDTADWTSRWALPDADARTSQTLASIEDVPLFAAINHYRQAFMRDPTHHRAGLNALSLQLLRRHLGREQAASEISHLSGGLQWSIGAALALAPNDYQARSNEAEYRLLQGTPASVRTAYRRAVAAAGGDWFALDSIRQTPCRLRALDCRVAESAAALEIIDDARARATPPLLPRQVFLFSGHMADAPDRATPRLPVGMEPAAAAAIAATLDALGAGPDDLALTQGACGGDILFLEACKARGLRLHLMLPLPEPEFLERSVSSATHGARWRARYNRIRRELVDRPRILSDELGPPGQEEDSNPFERCNRWLLATALSWGIGKLSFICLWNGEGGDGPGGTAHMYGEVKRRSGKVSWIDTRTLSHHGA